MKKTKVSEKADRICYRAGICIIIFIMAAVAVCKRPDIFYSLKLPPCMFHMLTGYYCPGCGGTRAVIAFFRGELVKSFCYHPIVCYTFFTAGWFMISQTAEKITKGRWHIGMHYRSRYLWIALVIVLVHFAAVNLWAFYMRKI